MIALRIRRASARVVLGGGERIDLERDRVVPELASMPRCPASPRRSFTI
jgi:hypothetical protein